jgi:hypothetical protein
MLAVLLRPGGQFGLVGRFHALLAIPPGAAAVQIGPDLRGADGSHGRIVYQYYALAKKQNLIYSSIGVD